MNKLQRLLTQVCDEKVTQEMKFEGIRDERGPFSRYLGKVDLSQAVPENAAAWVLGGCGFDSCGVWGLEPTSFLLSGDYTPDQVKLVSQIQYLRYHPGEISEDYVKTLLNEGVNAGNFLFWKQAKQKERFLKDLGLKWPKSVWNLGRKSWKKVYDYAVSIVGTGKVIRMGYTPGTYFSPTLVETHKKGFSRKFCRHLERCLTKYERRKKIREGLSSYPDGYLRLNNLKAYVFCKGMRTEENVSLQESSVNIGGNYYFFTSIFFTHNGLVSNIHNGQGDVIYIKRKGDISFIKTPAGYTCWRANINVRIDVPSLRDGIEFLNHRRYVSGNEISFMDVRDDIRGYDGYCITGVKRFLKDRMPFLYRIIEPYSNWRDIPTDILTTRYILAGKAVFHGYPCPLK